MVIHQYNESWTEEQIFKTAKKLEGLSLGQIDKSGWLNTKKNKGNIGNMIQSDFFGIPANSIKGPDFNFHHIELKVTPIIPLKNDGVYSSKERLVLGMINYMNDYKIPFEESIVYKKANAMLLIFYLHEQNKDLRDFKIIKTVRFNLPNNDFSQVEQDYNSITTRIQEGTAEYITEKEQKILGACTKGAGKGKDFVKQPFSNVLAKSRAYSYKSGYMTNFFRKIYSPEKIEHISFSQIVKPDKNIFIDNILKTLDNFVGKTDAEIRNILNIKKSGKSDLFNIISKIFNSNGNINQTEEFLNEGLAIKTVQDRFTKGKNQDMSFPNLDFTELLQDEYDTSSWISLFEDTKYILCVWRELEDGNNIFLSYKLWEPDNEFLQQLKDLYHYLHNLILNENAKISIEYNAGGDEVWKDNISTSKKSYYPLQIRTKGTKNSKFVTLPDGTKTTKKCLFVDKRYIRKIIGLE